MSWWPHSCPPAVRHTEHHPTVCTCDVLGVASSLLPPCVTAQSQLWKLLAMFGISCRCCDCQLMYVCVTVSFCTSVWLSPYVCLCDCHLMYVCVTVTLCMSVWLSVYVRLCDCQIMYVCVTVSLCTSVWLSPYVRLCDCHHMYVCATVTLCTSVWLSVYVSLCKGMSHGTLYSRSKDIQKLHLRGFLVSAPT